MEAEDSHGSVDQPTMFQLSFLKLGVAFVALAVMAVGLKTRKWFGKKEPIFREDCIQSHSDEDDTVELDEKKRNAILKQGFSPEKVPTNLDAIFIGSGIGSLSCAVLMAKAGKKVLVLEQHDRAGGCCHTFVEKDYEFDTGIHYIGGQRVGDPDRILLDQLTGGRLKWDKLDDVYDVTIIGKGKEQRKYNVRSGSREIWENELIKQFPGEEEAIRKFAQACKEAPRTFTANVIVKLVPYWLAKILITLGVFNWFFQCSKWNKTYVKDFVDSLTQNKDLRLVFQYLFGDYGSSPSESSFCILGAVHKHYWRGAFYPRGGASEIPYHIIKEIQRPGGAVLVRAKVTSIILDSAKKQAIGVKVEKGSSTYDVYAPLVVSGAGFVNTFDKFLPPDVTSSLNLVRSAKQKVKGSVACFQGFFGFKVEEGDSVDVPQHNTWYYKSNQDIASSFEEYVTLEREEALDADPPFVFIGFPSTKDSSYAKRHPGKIACTIISVAPYEWFEKWSSTSVSKRGDDYDGIKNTIGQRLLDIVLEQFPQLEDKLEYCAYGTGVTTNHYLGTNYGELYGLDHDASRFSLEAQAALRPQTGIKGLYITGQDVLSAGFIGALSAGVLTASVILERNLFTELEKYVKDVKKQMQKFIPIKKLE